MDHKKSVLAALEGHAKKQIKQKRSSKNRKPEARVVADVMLWASHQGWQIQRVESKNTFNPRAQRWISSPTTPGTADILGVTDHGTFVAIEAKAPGRLGTLRENQREWLIQKINSNAFCVVTDSVARLEKIYNCWRSLNGSGAREYLLGELPNKKTQG